MKLVLLDLDNTLIDSSYLLTAPEEEFRSLVSVLARKGVSVGLCSDSAMITLRQWSDRLGLTGPIVAERGAVVWDSERQVEDVVDASKTDWFRSLRESFVQAVLRDFPGATIFVGDATRFVKSHWASQESQQIFAVNGFRTASFSFFACRTKNDHSTLEPFPELLEHSSVVVEDLLVKFDKRRDELFWDENAKYGILIVHSRDTEKSLGVSSLLERLSPEQTVMIGDGMSDFLGLSQVEQYAVGNADPHYKNKATFIAKHTLTEGVIECLQRFL